MTRLSKKREEETAFDIKFCEGLIEKVPDFLQALILLGDMYTRCGRYAEGLVVDQKLAALRPEDEFIQYNLACSYSLLGHIEEAFTALRRAVELGYDEFEYIKEDEDLKNLHEDPRFYDFFSRLKVAGNN